MEAQDPVNERLESRASDDAHFESVNEPEEQAEPESPEEGQLDLQDQQDSSFESPGEMGGQAESEGLEEGQLDLQDQQDSSFQSPEETDERQESDIPEDTRFEPEDRADEEPEADEGEDDRLASENFVSDRLDLLIGEIDRAVDIIRQLREEIAGLEQRNGELRQQLEDKDQVINGLQADRERLRSIYDNNASLIENKEEIQRKIETMISRLDSVNTA